MDYYAHGVRIAMLVVMLGRRKLMQQRRRAAELMAVALICDEQRRNDLHELETEHRLLMLRNYP
jgi:hypothetical protein